MQTAKKNVAFSLESESDWLKPGPCNVAQTFTARYVCLHGTLHSLNVLSDFANAGSEVGRPDWGKWMTLYILYGEIIFRIEKFRIFAKLN
ncbi:MAG: hypothetical protein J6W03_09120 [Bacteroidaceae bacterium]|nr:hypothetical protein [Bacteroidaceae bacterium]